MNEEFDEDESEGVGSQVLADLIVKEAVEHFVVEELEEEHERDREDEEVQDVVKEEVVVP